MHKFIDDLASFGYGVYTIPTGYAVADPQDNEDGFYLEVPTLDQVRRECEYLIAEATP